MTEKLKQELKPLYSELVKLVPSDYSAFCVQWGKYYPTEDHRGILFVGRATNGWISEDLDPEILFGNTTDRIFDRADQMEWVYHLEGNQEPKGYNTRKSAFWRVIKGIASTHYPQEWYNHVAWSNVCKAAPYGGGNPSDAVYYETLDINCAILSKEIELLSPKIIVMLTKYNWAKDFITYLNGGKEPSPAITEPWDGYEAALYTINDKTIIVSEHPQCKTETPHIQAIASLIENAIK